MNAHNQSLEAFELRFAPLFDSGRAMSFPCGPEGHVNIDALSERSRNNYLFARAATGREFAWPSVTPALH